MSLWEAEVEKSKDNPSGPSRRRTPGRLFDNLIQISNKSKKRQDPGYPRFYRPSTTTDRPSDSRLAADRQALIKENARLRTRMNQMEDAPRSDYHGSSMQGNVDQIAQLIIQKSQLEQEMRKREKRYESLLTESQNLLRQMRSERDAAKSDAAELKAEVRALQRQQSLRILSHSQGRSRSPIPPLDFDRSPLSFAEPIFESTPAPLLQSEPLKAALLSDPLDQTKDLATIFERHDDQYFIDQYHDLETCIRDFVLDSMKSQRDIMPECELSSSMDLYISKHNLQIPTVFGIRDVRCIVCRGFIIEFLLERIFRVFLFGIDGTSVNNSLREAFQAISAIDRGRGSKWAVSMARAIVRGYKGYHPRRASQKVVDELRDHLSPFITTLNAAHEGLLHMVLKAVKLARDCRLDLSSFLLEMPPHMSSFDPSKMEAAQSEQGNVAISYFPSVSKRGNKDGEGYQLGLVMVKAKVWRDSIFSDLQDLMNDRADWDNFSENDSDV